METSNAFLRKACTISMRIPGKFRIVFCKFLIFVSELASLLCQVSENSNSSFSWSNVIAACTMFRKIFVDLKWYLWIICWLSKFLNWQFESLLLYSLRSLKGYVKFSSLLLQLSVISKESFCKKLLLISNPFLKIFWFLKIMNF